jgi:hypothetical protein
MDDLVGKAQKVGYSGLEPRERDYLNSEFAYSKAAKRGLSLPQFADLLDNRAGYVPKMGEIFGQDYKPSFPRTVREMAEARAEKAGSGQMGWAEAAASKMMPEYTTQTQLEKAGLEPYSLAAHARTSLRDAFNAPGRTLRSMFDVAGSLLTGEGISAGLSQARKDIGDPTGVFGDPMLSVGMALPMARTEQVAEALGARGLGSLAESIRKYPRLAASIIYPAEGIAQGAFLKNAGGALEGSKVDAANVAQASTSPVPLQGMNALEIAASAGGGVLGGLGRHLSTSSLRSVPGIQAEIDLAERLYGTDPAASLQKWGSLLDESKAWTEGGIRNFGKALKNEAKPVTAQAMNDLAPIAQQFKKDIAARKIPFREIGNTGEFVPAVSRMDAPYTSEILGMEGLPGDAETQLTKTSLAKMIQQEAAMRKYGAGEGIDVSRKLLPNRISRLLSTFDPVDPAGRITYADLPDLLHKLNKPAFNTWASNEKEIARSLGQIGRDVVAPMYWQNPALNNLEEMATARTQFGKAADIERLLHRGHTARIEDFSNIVGKTARNLGLEYQLPLLGIRLGKALEKSAASAATAGRGAQNR